MRAYLYVQALVWLFLIFDISHSTIRCQPERTAEQLSRIQTQTLHLMSMDECVIYHTV